MIKYIFPLLLLLFISGCSYSSNRSNEKNVFITLSGMDENNVAIDIIKGESHLIKTSYSSNVYKAYFEPVDGGESYILGFKYKEVHGDAYPRLSILQSNVTLGKVSLNEILKMDFENIDGKKVYKISL